MAYTYPTKYFILTSLLMIITIASYSAETGNIHIVNTRARQEAGTLYLNADILLDDLRLGSNRQLYVTPVVSDSEGHVERFPSVLVNGHAMQIAYERHTLPTNGMKVLKAVQRKNNHSQKVEFSTSCLLKPWMTQPGTKISWIIDKCGCGSDSNAIRKGRSDGSYICYEDDLGLNPAPHMLTAFITPPVTELPVRNYEGEARVQYELSRSELHSEPYLCRNGQRIDNREQLRIIDDSIASALNDPNVEIASVSLCGYASPEGSYVTNERLATDRSRSLALYIADRYNLPSASTRYDAVAENWEGFRNAVVNNLEISEEQRSALLSLIDRPVYGPADYDAKEHELTTSPVFAALYRSKILPDWFPKLRITRFTIATRLKPMSDENLAEVILSTPEKLSLNQMFRVARLYPEGSDDFNRVISTALHYYPEDTIANLNAAVAALRAGDTEKAGALLENAGDSPEARNARGVMATVNGRFDEAREFFNSASPLPEALRNLELLGK